MRFCYLDESGSPELTGGTSHFVLLGLSILGETWKAKDDAITLIKRRFGLADAEVHAGWLLRRYVEQERIPDFETMGVARRRGAVQTARDQFLIRLAAVNGPQHERVKNTRKGFAKTSAYIHLTLAERRELMREIAATVGAWDDCRLFAECTDKRTFGGVAPRTPPFEEAFTQIVTRLNRFLEDQGGHEHGLLVQDRNDTVARRLTELMRIFHERGTRWAVLRFIVETPLFVDSRLTSMVQVADVCAYATRRFFENGETELFDLIYPRFARAGGRVVGIRHYTNRDNPAGRRCNCRVCTGH